jgi:4-amino-4-deoxy-L-arabinose transferase-like glycosyltransferase
MQSTPAQPARADLCPAPLNLVKAAPAPSSRKTRALSTFIRAHWLELAGAFLILCAGFALRLMPVFGVPDRLSLDEHLYITNVTMLKKVGPFEYSALVQSYVHAQSQMEMVMLPPTRCVYILLGWAWDAAFHSGPRMSLRYVAAIFSCLSLLLSGLFAFRLGGARMGLTVGALMAVAPLELVMAHRELVDGVFAFWALLSLWLLWENMQRPGRLGWLAAYAGSIAVMVLTKENSFFAAVALGGILCTAAAFPGLNLGKAKWSVAVATIAGGALGVTVLVCIAGSPQTLIETYRLLVSKAEKMAFAYETGGGPWFRYIVDIMLLSPTILLPAIGGIFALRRENRQGIYLFLFMLFSCAVMVNVRNGMNLRYSTMWDMPLRYLAAGTILHLAGAARRWQILAPVLLLALVGGVELHQYYVIFVQQDTGDPVTQALMYALQIIRPAP